MRIQCFLSLVSVYSTTVLSTSVRPLASIHLELRPQLFPCITYQRLTERDLSRRKCSTMDTEEDREGRRPIMPARQMVCYDDLLSGESDKQNPLDAQRDKAKKRCVRSKNIDTNRLSSPFSET